MATTDATITGTFDDKTFQFYIDGVATHGQMDKLLDKVDALLKRFKADQLVKNQAEKERKAEKEQIAATNELRDKEHDSIEKRIEVEHVLNRVLSLQTSGIRGFLQPLDRSAVGLSVLAGVLGGAIGGFKNLLDYSVHVGNALQMGIGGGVMDFAVSAKTAGVNLADFTKALQESGGGFAQLGGSATEGSRQFANLVREVRQATGSIGNLGLTNEQLAVFTAQQLKVAVSQGMRGRRAQEFVIENTREFGKELDELASRTGKSVVELAQAAMKVSTNPVIASFVKDAGALSGRLSTSAQKMVASFSAIFGERGAKVAEEALQSAMAGLPYIISKSGQELFTISSNVASEVERQAKITARGGEITEADRERLRNLVLQETKARGQELRQLASMPGPLQEAALQILNMAKDAEFYNSREGRERKRQSDAARKFVEESNKLKATLQELSVPFLQLLNGIDWAGIFSVFNGLLQGIKMVLTPLSWLGKFLGDTGMGSLLGAFIAIATVGGSLYLVFKNLALVVGGAITAFKALGALFGVKKAKSIVEDIAPTAGRRKGLGSVLDIFGSRAQEVSLIGRGDKADKPLFVYVINGGPGLPGLPGGPLGGNVPGTGGGARGAGAGTGAYRAGAKQRIRDIMREQGLTREQAASRYRAEEAGRAAGQAGRGMLDWLKTNKLAVLGVFGGLAGAGLRESGERDLEENGNTAWGKTKEVLGTTLEYAGLFSGALLLMGDDLRGRIATGIKNFGSSIWENAKMIKEAGIGKTLKSWGGMAANTFSEMLPKLKSMGTTALDFGKKVFGTGKGMLGSLGSSGVLGAAGKFLGKVALPLTAIMGGYAAYKGFNADKEASLGEKLKNAGSSLLNDLTFGLFGTDADEIAKRKKQAAEQAADERKTKLAESIITGQNNRILGMLAAEGSIKLKNDNVSDIVRNGLFGQSGSQGLGSSFQSQAVLPGFDALAMSVQNAQSMAIDQERMKAVQNQNSNSKMIELLGEIKMVNETALGIQAKGVSVADSSNKYLRDQRFLGWTGPAA
jgi:hypothetical protein